MSRYKVLDLSVIVCRVLLFPDIVQANDSMINISFEKILWDNPKKNTKKYIYLNKKQKEGRGRDIKDFFV